MAIKKNKAPNIPAYLTPNIPIPNKNKRKIDEYSEYGIGKYWANMIKGNKKKSLEKNILKNKFKYYFYWINI